MSVEVLRTYHFRCDATECPSSILTDSGDAPSDWSTVSSTAHHLERILPSVKSPRARLRSMNSDSMRSVGRFQLHLCPEHPEAFAGHRAQTDNPGGQGVIVSCSCGAQLGLMPKDAKAAWLRHFHEASRATLTQGQTPPSKGERVT